MLSTKQIAQTNVSFMSRVYFWMMLGLALSGIIAYGVASSPNIMQTLQQKPMIWLGLIILQIAAVAVLSFLFNRINAFLATVLYLSYAILSGITLSVIFLSFTQASIAQAFFITAFAFVGLSVYGFVTKRDLGPLGTFCMTGLFGLIGFIFIVMLFPSIRTNAVMMTIDTLTILIFAGLTAYDTQKIKNFNLNASGYGMVQKAAVYGALMLYLDFINIFLSVLRLMGDRR